MKHGLIIATNNLSRTGVPSVYMSIIRHFTKNGWSFDLLYFDNSDLYYLDELKSLGVNLLYYREKNNRIHRYISASFYTKIAKRIIKQNKYDLIHSFKEAVGYPFLRIAYKRGVGIRINHTNISFHGTGNIINRLLFKKEKKKIIKYSTHLIGCSDVACLSAYGHGVDFTSIINTYDEKRFVFSSEIPSTNHIVLSQIGGLSNLKNQLFSINVLKELQNYYPSSELILVGDEIENGYKTLLQENISQLNISNNVIFKNKNENIIDTYKESHYVIFPSRSEGFGIVTIEAQAVGLKCFASTNVPKSTNAGNIIYLPLEDGPKKWAKAIADDFKTTGAKRIKLDMHNFSNSEIMKKYEAIYGK